MTERMGWFPDPENPGLERYFDGQSWTDQRRAVAQPTDPPELTPHHSGVTPSHAAGTSGLSARARALLVGGSVALVVVLGLGTALALARTDDGSAADAPRPSAAPSSSSPSASPSPSPSSSPSSTWGSDGQTLVAIQVLKAPCSEVESDNSIYRDHQEGTNVTLVNRQKRVVSASSWTKNEVQPVDNRCRMKSTFRDVPWSTNVVGLDTSGSRPIYWANVSEFPLSLIV